MKSDEVLNWVRNGLESLRDDAWLLERDVNERCVTAKLGCYLHYHLPTLVGEGHARLPNEQRFHVDCEYNRFEDDTKWFPWDEPVVDETAKKVYYTPIPDIILHKRGSQGPNILVIETKKEDKVNDFTSLIDRLKLIGYLGPNMNYCYGLYLSLERARGRLIVAAAELVQYNLVRDAKTGKGGELWNRARELVTSNVSCNGRVKVIREPTEEMKARAGVLCEEIVRTFSFTDVKDRLMS
jgi:hypothetical protein